MGISGYGINPLGGYIYGRTGGTAVQNASESIDMQNVSQSVGKTSKAAVNPGESEKVAPGRRSSPAECQTCKERKYQDGSDEMVSFKSAAHISPDAAGARVRAHEQEHVTNAYSKATMNDGKVMQASVAIHTAVCPECGRVYVSGGTTTTQIKYNNEDNPYQQNKKANDAMGLVGQSVDLAG